MVLEAPSIVEDRSSWEGLWYRPNGATRSRAVPRNEGSDDVGGDDRKKPGRPAKLVAIPYYAWADRGPSPMRVWIPVEM